MSLETLRIAVTADPELAIPPKYYGGAERIVDLLVRGLVGRGHAVTLFAHRDSQMPCRLVSYPARNSVSFADGFQNMMTIFGKISDESFDLVHSFGRLAYLLPLLPRRIPKIMSYGRWVSARSVAWGRRLSRGTLRFTACSHQMIEKVKHLAPWQVIYHGVPMDRFPFCGSAAADAPLIYLGRIEEGKGVHLAIEAARRAGRRLLVAGNIQPGHENYFQDRIRPELKKGIVEFVGEVDDQRKATLLGDSAALLFPVLWDEPFGIVLAEALACGTPVIGFRRGAVPEIIRHGYNGFICDSVQAMAQAVSNLGSIERAYCRKVAEQKFSDKVVVDQYERLYRSCASHP